MDRWIARKRRNRQCPAFLIFMAVYRRVESVAIGDGDRSSLPVSSLALLLSLECLDTLLGRPFAGQFVHGAARCRDLLLGGLAEAMG